MSIYCAQCGKEGNDDARFCAACGRPVAGANPYTPGLSRTLVRPRIGRKVGGVCQAITNLYGWDVTVVRIVMALLAIILFPIGFVIYALVWLIAPEEPLALPATTYVQGS